MDGDDHLDELAVQTFYMRQRLSIVLQRAIGTTMRATHNTDWGRVYAPQGDEPIMDVRDLEEEGQ